MAECPDDATPVKKSKAEETSPTKGTEERVSVLPGVPASPPKFITMEKLMQAAKGVKNMTLAHEIAVDNDFKIADPTRKSPLEKEVHAIVTKAFWDSLQVQLDEDPPRYVKALAMLEDLREVLKSLTLPRHTRLRSQIDEVFDMELIQQQVDHQCLNVATFASYVLDTLGSLCAPIRDDKLAELRREKEIVPLFRGIFELMDLMKMDMANFTIAQIRPHIQQQSVEYERSKFNEFVERQKEAGINGLDHAEEWLRSATKQVTGRKPSVGLLSVGRTLTPNNILNQAYIMLLEPSIYNNIQTFPETLLMDLHRFHEIQQTVYKLTVVSAILLVTFNTVGSPLVGIAGLKDKLKSQILILLEGYHTKNEITPILHNVSEQIIQEVNSVLEQHSFPKLQQTTFTLLTTQILECVNEGHSVHHLLSERIITLIRSMLTTPQPGPLQIPAGLSAVEQDLSRICGQFIRLVSHNRLVFGDHYSEMIDKILDKPS